MLGPSTRAGQERVEHLRRGGLVGHELVVLLLDPLDPGALLRLRRLSQLLERELEVLDMLTRLLEMVGEPLRELLIRRFLLQLREAPSPTSARHKAHRRARAGTARAGRSSSYWPSMAPFKRVISCPAEPGPLNTSHRATVLVIGHFTSSGGGSGVGVGGRSTCSPAARARKTRRETERFVPVPRLAGQSLTGNQRKGRSMSTTTQDTGTEGIVDQAKSELGDVASNVQEKAVELKEQGRGKLGETLDRRTTEAGGSGAPGGPGVTPEWISVADPG